MRGTPKASVLDEAASSDTNCQAANVRSAATVVLTMPVQAEMTGFRPAGSACAMVPIESSRSSRAAAMPPSMPISNVR
jgi:hypothetical protein